MSNEHFRSEFIGECLRRIRENTDKLNVCLRDLDENEVWKRPNEHSNSVGNLILHLCGNIGQYAISSLGKTADYRKRDAEFSAQSGYSKQELTEKLNSTSARACDVIQNVTTEELLRERNVQGFALSGTGIIIHVTEHYSYHTGQIIFWLKLLKDKDLGFYAGIDLNVKNEDAHQ